MNKFALALLSFAFLSFGAPPPPDYKVPDCKLASIEQAGLEIAKTAGVELPTKTPWQASDVWKTSSGDEAWVLKSYPVGVVSGDKGYTFMATGECFDAEKRLEVRNVWIHK